jgi:hypothetical protein
MVDGALIVTYAGIERFKKLVADGWPAQEAAKQVAMAREAVKVRW